MNKFFSFALALLLTAFLVACGGGGDTSAEKTEMTQEEPQQEMMSSGGYTAGDVMNGGTITGKVTYAGAMPAVQKLEVTKDVSVCGQKTHFSESMVVSEDMGLANVVVKITDITSGKTAMAGASELDQNGCLFIPHVTMVAAGAELTILNSDGILHNIHTFSETNAAVNKAQPGFNKRMNLSFAEPEVFRIACDVHNWMSGYIVVTDHPYYALTDASGNFELTDVPAGTYTLEYWQESLGTQTQEVTVAEGGSAMADFEYPAGS